jgi:hypothetical protein
VISLTRETVPALVATGNGLIPSLVVYRHEADAWRQVQALDEVETALLEDRREDESGAFDPLASEDGLDLSAERQRAERLRHERRSAIRQRLPLRLR